MNLTIFGRYLKNKLLKLTHDVVILIIAFFILIYYFNIFTVKREFKNSNNSLRLLNSVNSTLEFQSRSKHILLWTGSNMKPFKNIGIGNKEFIKRKCKWTNCFISADRHFLRDYTEFDVIVFNGPQLDTVTNDLPVRRKFYQKYVYANREPTSYYPLCSNIWNDYFNWTWTYKLNSDLVWAYFVIRNASNHVVGPNQNINWLKLDDMDDIEEKLKNKLRNKLFPVAWFVSKCKTKSQREKYVKNLRRHMRTYDMDVDVYGICGKFGCPTEMIPRCLNALENRYYFYLVFESAIDVDYVTEELLFALNHTTVPIVFGGADYSRFMPEGSYLNAYKMKAETLAGKVFNIINNIVLYHNFFRWKKYYSYHLRQGSPDTDDFCNFCANINDEKFMIKWTNYKRLNKWWTGSNMKEICQETNKQEENWRIDCLIEHTYDFQNSYVNVDFARK